ncbi:MAG: hypothetical protein ABSF24_10200 [Candidatus Bathyarchaeia archaeon]|jgi:metal-responsive CopG/Arc/MetJ family transcriptional regulator
MKKRFIREENPVDIKIPISVAMSLRELRAVDRVKKRRGFLSRSSYIMDVVSKDVKRNGIDIR